MNAHPQIPEAELLEAAKPPAELLPRQPASVRLGEQGLRDGLLHRKALGRSL
ncbi:hypothetical protein [Archangium gephyra]|uniref:hypothetical protein n=1 Tax=Archangium gephyra TaxID=48 RepID=UPI0012E18DC8|nr:hypothetical protein [Archangium gephyra]